MTVALELRDISKRFGPVTALDQASLRVRSGTVHAVLGENGAGKTTLMRVAYGLAQPDAGEMRRGGLVHAPRHPSEAIAAGIGMVHQHFSLVPAMTVAENVVLGLHGSFRGREAADLVRRVSRDTGLSIDPQQEVRSLPVSAQQRVEILKALVRDAELLILDEPTAVLAPAEADDLLEWIRRFVSSQQRSAILITHKLREALAIADDVTVLRDGRTVLTGPAHETDESLLVRAMIGTDMDDSAPPRERKRGSIVLSLKGVGVTGFEEAHALHDVSADLAAGELVGIAAVEGSGQQALLRVLAGRLAPSSGSAMVPADVGFIPGDRHRDATVPEMSLTENLALRGLGSRKGLMRWKRLREHAQRIVGAYEVRSTGPDSPMSSLSGGNQQRFVVGRELDPLPSALIAENPTRGLDVRATAAVHERLRAARDAGAAVVMYSSDVDEVLAVADRVLVVHAGGVAEVSPLRDAVGRAMLGVTGV